MLSDSHAVAQLFGFLLSVSFSFFRYRILIYSFYVHLGRFFIDFPEIGEAARFVFFFADILLLHAC